MASFIYNKSKTDVAEGGVDFREAGADMRVILVMTNTTCDTEDDTATMTNFTTLDEFDGSGYTQQAAAASATIDNQVATEDLSNNRNEFDGDDIAFGALSAGTRLITGAVILRWVTNFASSVPVAYVDFSSTPGNFAANGSTITITWDTQGIIQIG